MSTPDEREAFEAWYRQHGDNCQGIGWVDRLVWSAWQARAALSAPQAAQPALYIGGPYADGSYAICDLATGRVIQRLGLGDFPQPLRDAARLTAQGEAVRIGPVWLDHAMWLAGLFATAHAEWLRCPDARQDACDAARQKCVEDLRQQLAMALAPSPRQPDQRGEAAPRDDQLCREHLGRIVRQEWVRWASEQPSPKPSWLQSWEALTDPEREVDRRIGEALLSHIRIVNAATFDAASPSPDQRQAREGGNDGC